MHSYGRAQQPIEVNVLPEHLNGLLCESAWPHSVTQIQVVETHISWIVLTGDWAYKIKKPVKLDFADFSTLENRRHFCQEEIRLNRQYTEGIYDSVVPISLTDGGINVGDSTDVIEFAVKMSQFPSSAHVLTGNGTLNCDSISLKKFGQELAKRHRLASKSVEGLGNPRSQLALVSEAAAGLMAIVDDPLLKRLVTDIHNHIPKSLKDSESAIAERYEAGRVRECHGDLHLGNLIQLDGEVTAFDALEFNRDLRFTDVAADVAFLCMDLEAHGYDDESFAFLAGWVAESGDYGALPLLRFYKLYRALVRARVSAIALVQTKSADRARQLIDEVRRYVALSQRYLCDEKRPCLFVMRGLSGSGKSWLARRLATGLGALRISSDVERKRNQESSDYSSQGRHRVYELMHVEAENALRAGYSVVLDATHLVESTCAAARRLSDKLSVRFLVLDLHASHDQLVSRIRLRQQTNNDASEADETVLQRQVQNYRQLSPQTARHSLRLEVNDFPDVAALTLVIPWLASGSASGSPGVSPRTG